MRERQSQLTGDHLNKLTYHSNKKVHLVKAGSCSHLHSARSDIFLLKLQMMARTVRFELTSQGFGGPYATITPDPYMAEETRFELVEVLPSLPFQDSALNHSATLP